MTIGDDDAKKTILARRASFVAAAMVGIACGKSTADPPPMPCLSIAWIPDAGPPLLSTGDAAVAPEDTGDAGSGTITTDDRDAGGAAKAATDGGKRLGREPQPIPVPNPVPMPCLSVRPPNKAPPSKQ